MFPYHVDEENISKTRNSSNDSGLLNIKINKYYYFNARNGTLLSLTKLHKTPRYMYAHLT